MNQDNNLSHYENADDEIDLREIFDVFWSQKRLIVICTALASIIALMYSLYLPNKYTSKALLAPTQQSESISNSLSSISGLASLAGVSMPSSSAGNITEEAWETLSSFAFFKDNILPNIFLPDLMAVKSCDAKTNTLSYKQDLYDITDNKWEVIPSAQLAFTVYQEIFTKSRDTKTGFTTISIKHQSPYVARAWLDSIVSAINKQFRQDQKIRASLSIEYLNKQIAKTSYTEIQQELSALIQQETEKLMLVEANQDYIFKEIDPPIVPELKSEPQRAFICIFGFLMGGILGLLLALGKHYLRENN